MKIKDMEIRQLIENDLIDKEDVELEGLGFKILSMMENDFDLLYSLVI